MFPFLTIFIIFLVILTYYIKKGNSTQQKVHEDFLEKERLANTTRKKDISNLNYITIPSDLISEKTNSETERHFFSLAKEPMLNLTGISNTDLKLTYGAQNLTALSEYDTNFLEFVSLIPEYATELINAEETQHAQSLLEFAVSCGADSKKIYLLLAELYHAKQDLPQIQALYDSANDLPELTQKAIHKELQNYLP